MVAQAKSELLSQYDALAAQTPPESVEGKRRVFVERFLPDALPTLSGDDLLRFVHGNARGEGVFYELENGDMGEPFGGIAGGSALKFNVYRARDDSGCHLRAT